MPISGAKTPSSVGKIRLATTVTQQRHEDDGAAMSASNHLSSAIRIVRTAFSSSAKTGLGREEKKRATNRFIDDPLCLWGPITVVVFRRDVVDCYRNVASERPLEDELGVTGRLLPTCHGPSFQA